MTNPLTWLLTKKFSSPPTNVTCQLSRCKSLPSPTPWTKHCRPSPLRTNLRSLRCRQKVRAGIINPIRVQIPTPTPARTRTRSLEVASPARTLPIPCVTAIIPMETKLGTVSNPSPVPGPPRSARSHEGPTSLATETKIFTVTTKCSPA